MKTRIRGNEITKALQGKHGWMPEAEIKKGDYIVSIKLGIGGNSPYYNIISIQYKNRNVAEITTHQYMLPSELAKIINKFFEF